MTRNSAVATHDIRRGSLRASGVPRIAPYFAGLFCLLMVGWLRSAPAGAQVATAAQAAAGDGSATCVDVAINDHSALSYECLNRRLMMTTTAPPRQIFNGDAVVKEPGNRQVGQTNFSSLSHRMGNSLGHSVMPQRPSSPPPSRVGLSAPLAIH